MRYSVEWFILQFRNIPAANWSSSVVDGGRGLGHVYAHLAGIPGIDLACAIEDLRALFSTIGKIPTCVNDATCELFHQDGSKARILAALYMIKRNSSSKSKQ